MKLNDDELVRGRFHLILTSKENQTENGGRTRCISSCSSYFLVDENVDDENEDEELMNQERLNYPLTMDNEAFELNIMPLQTFPHADVCSTISAPNSSSHDCTNKGNQDNSVQLLSSSHPATSISSSPTTAPSFPSLSSPPTSPSTTVSPPSESSSGDYPDPQRLTVDWIRFQFTKWSHRFYHLISQVGKWMRKMFPFLL